MNRNSVESAGANRPENRPYRFYFYSHEPNEPRHIHADRDDLSAKFWLEPVGLAMNFGFSAVEQDGRTISVPLAWYPRLLHASKEQLSNWKIAGGGYGIHWPDLDEDLSTEGLLRGAPAPRHTSNTKA